MLKRNNNNKINNNHHNNHGFLEKPSTPSNKQKKLFLSLIEEVSTNVGFKYNEISNLLLSLIESNKWMNITKDRKHGGKFGIKVETTNGFKISDSFLNINGKIEPRTIGNLKNFLKAILLDSRFINPFN